MTGGVAAVAVEEIERAEWRDLGMPETLWNCRVKEFGPLIVSIDAQGRNYFEEKKVEYNKRKDEQIEKICKEVLSRMPMMISSMTMIGVLKKDGRSITETKRSRK